MFNEKRIQKAIRNSYAIAFGACMQARESLRHHDRLGYRAALETVQLHRRLNRDRRRALRQGSQVRASESPPPV